jgi:hypothetical protein
MEDVAHHILLFLVGSCCWPLPSFNLMNTQYVFLSSQFFCCNHHVLFFLIPSCYLLCFFLLSLKKLFINFSLPLLFSLSFVVIHHILLFLFYFSSPYLLFSMFFSFWFGAITHRTFFFSRFEIVIHCILFFLFILSPLLCSLSLSTPFLSSWSFDVAHHVLLF